MFEILAQTERETLVGKLMSASGQLQHEAELLVRRSDDVLPGSPAWWFTAAAEAETLAGEVWMEAAPAPLDVADGEAQYIAEQYQDAAREYDNAEAEVS